jgi:membrane fusion protein (multidrug efflux system)
MRSEEDTGKSGGKTSIANQSTANKTPAEDKTTKNNSESSGISSAAPVPQSDESQIESMNRPVEMGLVTEKGFPHKGKIDFVDNRVDPNTGTILVRGLFANPPPYALAPGLFVRIRVPVGTQTGAILIPDRALSTDQQGQYLLVVRPDNVVEHRVVEVGSLEGQMRVITSGVKPGEQFIVEGLQFARPGGKVTPVAESTTATSNDGKADADAPAKTSDAKPAPDNSPPPATNPTNKSPADDGAPKNKSE